MRVLCSDNDPRSADADLIAVAAGRPASALGVPQRASDDADPVATVYGQPVIAVIAVADGVEGLRTAAARALRASRPGESIAWAVDQSSPVALSEQVRALAEGAVMA